MVSVGSHGSHPPPRPGLGPALGVGILLAAGLVTLGIFEVSGPGDPSEADADPVPTTIPAPPPASAVLDAGPAWSVSDRVVSEGVLSVVDARPMSEAMWRLWAPAATRPLSVPLPRHATRMALSASGHMIGYVLPAGPGGGGSLWVRSADGRSVRVADDMLSFAWKQRDDGRIAWSEPADQGIRLVTATVVGEDVLTIVDRREIAEVEPGVVVGWTSLGVWVERDDEEEGLTMVSAYAGAHRTAVHRADIIVFHPSGDRYVIGSRSGRGWLLAESRRGDDMARIPWVLDDEELAVGAWSHGEPDRLALAGYSRDALTWWVAVWDLERGEVTHRLDLDLRVGDLSWSPEGRFLVILAEDRDGRVGVLVYDTAAGDVDTVPFESAVAAMIVPVPGAIVTTPELVGLPVETALSFLAAADLVGRVGEASAAVGVTIAQDPPPGTDVPAGTEVTITAVEPLTQPSLTALDPEATGNNACLPPSPYGPTLAFDSPEATLTEFRGRGDFELWAQLLTPPPLRINQPIKMLLRFDADGEPIFLARHPARRVHYARWGPHDHGEVTTGYDRPGQEWSLAFTVREPGCWSFRVVVGWEVSDIYARVW